MEVQVLQVYCNVILSLQMELTGAQNYYYVYVIIIFFSFSEMYHASRWLNNPRYYSPMASLPDGTNIFIRDFVKSFYCDLQGEATCVVVKLFKQV